MNNYSMEKSRLEGLKEARAPRIPPRMTYGASGQARINKTLEARSPGRNPATAAVSRCRVARELETGGPLFDRSSPRGAYWACNAFDKYYRQVCTVQYCNRSNRPKFTFKEVHPPTAWIRSRAARQSPRLAASEVTSVARTSRLEISRGNI